MYTYKYPHPSVTTDCVVFSYDAAEGLSVLLIKRKNDPFKGCWAFPGGFLNMDEDAETGARRELEEETGLHVPDMEQIGAFSKVDRDPRERVITIAHLALTRKADVKGTDDATDARWFLVAALPPLAFDHETVLKTALDRLKQQIRFKPVAFELLPNRFTMPQLQQLCELILDTKFDRRNFSAKIRRLGIVDKIPSEPRCIPVLYTFNRRRYDEKKTKAKTLIPVE